MEKNNAGLSPQAAGRVLFLCFLFMTIDALATDATTAKTMKDEYSEIDVAGG